MNLKINNCIVFFIADLFDGKEWGNDQGNDGVGHESLQRHGCSRSSLLWNSKKFPEVGRSASRDINPLVSVVFCC